MKSKVIKALSLGAILSLSPSAFSQAQFLVNANAFYDVPLQADSAKNIMGEMEKGLGLGAGLEVRPIRKLGVFGEFEYHTFSIKDSVVNSYDTMAMNIGAGARLPLRGAFTLNADVFGGLYSTTHEVDQEKLKYSGINLGARVSFRLNFAPSFNIGVGAGYSSFRHDDFALESIPLSAGMTVNLTEAFSGEQNVSGDLSSLEPVFPALYSWYANNSFGSVVVQNFEAEDISNVRVYFYLEQFMNQKTLCGSAGRVKPGKAAEIGLKAIFNPTMLSVAEKTNAKANIVVEYYRLGKRYSIETPVTIPIYNPNAMSWDDDRRAAVFVSANNSCALEFAKYVASAVRSSMSSRRNENLQLAQAVFGALSEYGMRYVVDPSSSYSANVGTTSIDFLQFPHQTLKFKAGDCDDLSILYCSLLESLGIESAFITVPGHIYAAFCLDISEEEGRKIYGDDEAIFHDGRTWIPVEVTMTQDSFAAARKYGINEWNKYVVSDNAMIYPMHSNWKEFKSVNVSTEGFEVKLPSRERIVSRFLN